MNLKAKTCCPVTFFWNDGAGSGNDSSGFSYAEKDGPAEQADRRFASVYRRNFHVLCGIPEVFQNPSKRAGGVGQDGWMP